MSLVRISNRRRFMTEIQYERSTEIVKHETRERFIRGKPWKALESAVCNSLREVYICTSSTVPLPRTAIKRRARQQQ
jgi:hypothetical protein